MSIIEYALTRCREIPYIKGCQRHFAVVVDRRGRLVSQATNSYSKTHPLMAKASKKLGMVKEYCHAEALALIRSKGKGEIK